MGLTVSVDVIGREIEVNLYLLYLVVGLVVFFLWMHYQGRTGKYWFGEDDVGGSLAAGLIVCVLGWPIVVICALGFHIIRKAVAGAKVEHEPTAIERRSRGGSEGGRVEEYYDYEKVHHTTLGA